MDQKAVFNMIRSRISAFASRRLSTTGAPHHCVSKEINELVIANFEVDGMAAIEAEVPATSLLRKDQAALEASGIRWAYAEQAMNLQRMAYLDKGAPNFSRKSYIDSVRYALMGLPENLSNQEAASIRGSLPPTVSDVDLLVETNNRAIGWKPAPGDRTVLQRCIAIIVALVVVLLHTILSYASIMVRVGAHYERKHNISQLIVSKGFVIASAVGRHSVVLSTKICAMKDGPVGKAVTSVASRTLESAAVGIQEGIGQGLVMIDTRPRRS